MNRLLNSTLLSLVYISAFGQGETLLAPSYLPYGLPIADNISSYDVIDINNDSIPDAVASFIINGKSSVLVKLGPDLDSLKLKPDFTYTFTNKNNPLYVAWSDIDCDTQYDIVVGENAQHQVDASIYILENTTVGILDFTLHNNLGLNTEDFAAIPSPIDYDDDGKEDLFVSDYNGNITIYRNTGSFTFSNEGTNIMGLNGFNFQCAFDELSNGKNLISYDIANGFSLFLFDGSGYTIDTNILIISNIGLRNTLFCQPHIRDLNNDGLQDAFLSVNTISFESKYFSENWLYAGTCPETLQKDEDPIYSSTYSANVSIESAGVVDNANGAVIFRANQEVILQPNFTVTSSSLFEILMEACVPN